MVWFAELESQVILSFGDALVHKPRVWLHVVEKSERDRLFWATEQNVRKPLRLVPLCPLLISDAFDCNAEKAQVCIAGYLNPKAELLFG